MPSNDISLEIFLTFKTNASALCASMVLLAWKVNEKIRDVLNPHLFHSIRENNACTRVWTPVPDTIARFCTNKKQVLLS
ncbi:hypothetical protein ANTQUA_LOCUS7433 [Anthophora quadrimaculata]